jgi:hypothetical protein
MRHLPGLESRHRRGAGRQQPRNWAEGLDESARGEFLSRRVGELNQPAENLPRRSWVTGLSAEKDMELAAATLLNARKPPVA